MDLVIDVVIVVIAAVVAWVLGMIWYHPKMFGTMRSKGVAPELTGTPGSMGMMLSLLMLIVVAYAALAVSDISYSPNEFWRVMLSVALAFFIAICAGGHMDGKGKHTYMIDAAYSAVAVTVASAIVYYTS